MRAEGTVVQSPTTQMTPENDESSEGLHGTEKMTSPPVLTDFLAVPDPGDKLLAAVSPSLLGMHNLK
ncbi:hypothetical protein LDENG_00073820 [Lucifuga dentata]|nr:hypothetical protein LDENG_00073820 [Lucifuga dentata]